MPGVTLRLALGLTTLSSLASLTPLLAQDQSESFPVPASRKFCFRGRPLPFCTAFAITEFGVARASENDPDFLVVPHVEPTVVFWELGVMRNIGARSALGGSVLFTSRFSIGMKARYRQWLGREFSLDVAPGLTLEQEGPSIRTPSFTGHIGINYGDWLGLGAMLETTRFGAYPFLGVPPTTVTKKFVVLRLGSYPGLITGGIAGVGLLVLGLILVSGTD